MRTERRSCYRRHEHASRSFAHRPADVAGGRPSLHGDEPEVPGNRSCSDIISNLPRHDTTSAPDAAAPGGRPAHQPVTTPGRVPGPPAPGRRERPHLSMRAVTGLRRVAGIRNLQVGPDIFRMVAAVWNCHHRSLLLRHVRRLKRRSGSVVPTDARPSLAIETCTVLSTSPRSVGRMLCSQHRVSSRGRPHPARTVCSPHSVPLPRSPAPSAPPPAWCGQVSGVGSPCAWSF